MVEEPRPPNELSSPALGAGCAEHAINAIGYESYHIQVDGLTVGGSPAHLIYGTQGVIVIRPSLMVTLPAKDLDGTGNFDS